MIAKRKGEPCKGILGVRGMEAAEARDEVSENPSVMVEQEGEGGAAKYAKGEEARGEFGEAFECPVCESEARWSPYEGLRDL